MLVRKDIENLTDLERDKLLFAFHKLQVADPGISPNLNEDSFYIIAGYHGQPFRGAGYGNQEWWGGYCHHGNVLFPTWHRAYLCRIEHALNNVSGFTDIALPYWNEFKKGVPSIFTQKEYTFQAGFKGPQDFNPGDITVSNGQITLIHSPLFSYKLQQGFYDNLARDVVSKDGRARKSMDYSKHEGYETVRCPYSGLVGPGDQDVTTSYNATIDPQTAADRLNKNVEAWLGEESETRVPGMRELYLSAALRAPNYTVFSNTTSAAKWNDDHYGRQTNWIEAFAVSLEQPHDGIHLAVGGYSMPNAENSRPYFPMSNGDMGENDTSSFDPIFYFHHCFVDLIFWLWQREHQAEQSLEIFENYPGTSPIDSQGPTAYMTADSHLNMETPLIPFKGNPSGKYLTSQDVVNIKGKDCGYDYDMPPIVSSPGPVETRTIDVVKKSSMPIVRISGISRAQRRGSFVIRVLARTPTGNDEVVAMEPVFSRWHVPSCANCSNTLNVTSHKVLHPDLRVKDNKSLIDLDPKERLSAAEALKLRMEVLENQREELKDEGRVLSSLNMDSKLDPGPTVKVMPGMYASAYHEKKSHENEITEILRSRGE